MSRKILMNKNTLAALKQELKEYNVALPVFEMKEQQLKEVVRIKEETVERLNRAIARTNEKIKPWVAVLGDDSADLNGFVKVDSIDTEIQEVAGVTTELVKDVHFEKIKIDLFNTPLWLDAAIEVLKDQINNRILVEVEKRNLEKLQHELAEARRMKNALKEVFIPEISENIRKIEIYLGDVERLAIGCAKLVKKKKQQKTVAA